MQINKRFNQKIDFLFADPKMLNKKLHFRFETHFIAVNGNGYEWGWGFDSQLFGI